MALPSTYAELQSVPLDIMDRTGDASLTSYAPIAIGLVESKLNRHLRVAEQEATTTLSGTDGVFTLPADFAEWRNVSDPTYGTLDLVSPEWATTKFPTNVSGIPQYFTVKGSTLTTYPASSSVALDYYQKIPALSDSNTTNWLLTNHPDVYLFMTLSELYAYAQNGEAALLWNQRGMTAVEEIKSSDQRKRYSGASARVRGPTP